MAVVRILFRASCHDPGILVEELFESSKRAEQEYEFNGVLWYDGMSTGDATK